MTFMLDLMMDVLACWIMPRRRQLGLLALLASAVVVAFVVDDRSSLGAALYYLALATALVAALGLAHESGLWSKVAAFPVGVRSRMSRNCSAAVPNRKLRRASRCRDPLGQSDRCRCCRSNPAA